MKIYDSIIEVAGKQYIVHEQLTSDVKMITYMKSGWGNEYRKSTEQFGRYFELEETKGRSSATAHPFLDIEYRDGSKQTVVIAYSGNWKVEIEKTTRSIFLKVSIEDFKISANAYIPRVYILDEAEEVKSLYLKKESDEILNQFPVSYNHWWSYEDQNVNEANLLANSEIAKRLGVEYVVLDAGWFGASDEWMNIRGDWQSENTEKFPSGIESLSQKIRNMDLKFGIWVEIEAVGHKAKLREQLADYIAEVNGEKTDLLCFGNTAVQEWAYQMVKQMIVKYNATWIKMDFNIDPNSGCTCPTHEHDIDAGNQAHISGLYAVVNRLKEEFQSVIFENCSSGGQRSDQKIIDIFDVNFLSDADYIEHKTRCFKNSMDLIPNYKNYHFIPSMTLTDFDSGFRSTDFRKMSQEEINYNLVPALYGLTGISHRLVDYDQEILKVMENFFQAYNTHKLEFISDNEPNLVVGANMDIISYTKQNQKLIGIMSHTEQELDLEADFNAVSIIDLLEDKPINTKLKMKAKEGKLLLVKGE